MSMAYIKAGLSDLMYESVGDPGLEVIKSLTTEDELRAFPKLLSIITGFADSDTRIGVPRITCPITNGNFSSARDMSPEDFSLYLRILKIGHEKLFNITELHIPEHIVLSLELLNEISEACPNLKLNSFLMDKAAAAEKRAAAAEARAVAAEARAVAAEARAAAAEARAAAAEARAAAAESK